MEGRPVDAKSPQLSLFEAPPAGPEGLACRADFVTAEEEADLARELSRLPFREFEFHGFLGKRRTVSFGWRYAFDGSGLHEAEPMPDFLRPLRDRAAAFAGLGPEAFAHALVTEYAAGAGIGWHKDRSVFDEVVGVSLLAPARLRFRRRSGTGWERFTLDAQPRSAYLLTGKVRSEWEHSIPAMEALRYSVTFRTLKP